MGNRLKYIIAVIIALICILAGWVLFGHRSLTAAERQALDEAYNKAKASIATHAAALENWYLDYCKEATLETAESLTGLKATWTVIVNMGDEKKIQEFAEGVIAKHLFTPEQCENQLYTEIGKTLMEWRDIENELAEKTECYSLESSHNAAAQKGTPADFQHDLVRKKIYETIVLFVGTEVATEIVLATASSIGIISTSAAFSPETLGISLVAGAVIAYIVNLFTDPEKDVRVMLDEQVKKTGATQRKIFEETLNKALESQRKDWENKISSIL